MHLFAVSMILIKLFSSSSNYRLASLRSSYKCGVFFENLSGAQGDLTWLGAVPDIFSKKSARRNPDFFNSFGIPINASSFDLEEGKCAEVVANARCYVIVSVSIEHRSLSRANKSLHSLHRFLQLQKLSKALFDSCDESVLNELKGRTAGDALCHKATLHAPLAKGEQKNVQVGFYYSACGSPWFPVKDSLTKANAKALIAAEPLCCRSDPASGESTFYRCNGSQFESSCPLSRRR